MTLIADLKTFAAKATAELAEASFGDHSRTLDRAATIADMAMPDTARGNCWVASNEVYESGLYEEHGEYSDIVGVQSEGFSHYALLVERGDESVVVDYTARQFHADAPFPFIIELDKWKAYMEHTAGRELDLYLGDDDDED